ncbi:MAG: helix-turn-helix domain-containing protein, partial [Thermomicrobiales bacterium]
MTAAPAPTLTTPVRRTAEERREDVLEAALVEFATFGYHGGSTERIAAAAGISQPYVLRLFGSKKALFIATHARVCDRIMQV